MVTLHIKDRVKVRYDDSVMSDISHIKLRDMILSNSELIKEYPHLNSVAEALGGLNMYDGIVIDDMFIVFCDGGKGMMATSKPEYPIIILEVTLIDGVYICVVNGNLFQFKDSGVEKSSRMLITGIVTIMNVLRFGMVGTIKTVLDKNISEFEKGLYWLLDEHSLHMAFNIDTGIIHMEV